MSVTASRDLSFIEDENDEMYEICEKDRNMPFFLNGPLCWAEEDLF